MGEQGGEGFSAASTFLVSADLIPPEQSTDAQSIQSHVLELRESALFEEQSGCFGKAEVLWKKATGLAERYLPASQLIARVAIDTGSFLSRFLPKSQIPLKYLRAGLSLSHLLGPDEVTKATLTLSECLFQCQYYREAEDLLSQLDRSNPKTDVQVLVCLGANEYAQRDIIKAESTLREAAEKAQSISAELHAECVVRLCEVIEIKEQYAACQSLLLSIIDFLVSRQSPLLLPALRTLLKAYRETNQYAQLDSTLESVTTELKNASASPYYIAAILVEWGDIYAEVCRTYATLHYIQSLRLYQSVRLSSWYVAGVLFKVYQCQSPSDSIAWPERALTRSREVLNGMASELPVAITVLSRLAVRVHFSELCSYCTWLRAKLEPLLSSSDDIECGEALMRMTNRQEVEQRLGMLQAYTNSHPNSLLSARLLTHLLNKSTEALEICRKAGVSLLEVVGPLTNSYSIQSELAFRKAIEELCAAAPVSISSLRAMGLFIGHTRWSRSEETISMVQRALDIAKAINPLSSRFFSLYFNFNPPQALEDSILQALSAANPQCPLVEKMIDVVTSVINFEYPMNEAEKTPQRMAFIRKLDEMACLTPLHFAFIERAMLNWEFYNNLHGFCKRLLLYCSDSEGSVTALFRQLQVELDWFTGEQRELLIPYMRMPLQIAAELHIRDIFTRHREEECFLGRGLTMMGR